jgi:hypothetical protein
MKALLSLFILIASGNILAADTKNTRVFVERIGEDLIVTAISGNRIPELSEIVDEVLLEKIGSDDLIAPRLFSSPIVRGEKVFENSAAYSNFFSAPLIKDSDWSSEAWICAIRNKCLKKLVMK